MVKYVSEEVDRVKAMFAEKEKRLSTERDQATRGSLDATQQCHRLNGELAKIRTEFSALETELKVCCAGLFKSCIESC